jgi:hypothetical protein
MANHRRPERTKRPALGTRILGEGVNRNSASRGPWQFQLPLQSQKVTKLTMTSIFLVDIGRRPQVRWLHSAYTHGLPQVKDADNERQP